MDYDVINFINNLDLSSTTESSLIGFTSNKNNLNPAVHEKLMPHQISDVIKLKQILTDKKIALDTSDPGIGKTYKAAAVCVELAKRPIVICPKSTMYQWHSVLTYMNCTYYDIVNYDTIKTGQTYCNCQFNSRTTASYLEFDENKTEYKWQVKPNTIVIFDEVHLCKNYKKRIGKLFSSSIQLKLIGIPILLLSATIMEKPIHMTIPLYLSGVTSSIINYKQYAKRKTNIGLSIHNDIQPFMCRTTIQELGDMFPHNHVCGQEFCIDDYEQVAKAYDLIDTYTKQWKIAKNGSCLAKIQKLNQIIEIKKVPIFIEQTKIYLQKKKSVIIFVNFLATLQLIVDELDIKCIINGDQTVKQRQKSIDLFQSNVHNIIICQCRAGSVGISLNDIHNTHPRVCLISCPDSVTDLQQILGRAVRAGTKSVVLQRIIFVANVKQEHQKKINIDKKIKYISELNDGKLGSTNILDILSHDKNDQSGLKPHKFT